MNWDIMAENQISPGLRLIEYPDFVQICDMLIISPKLGRVPVKDNLPIAQHTENITYLTYITCFLRLQKYMFIAESTIGDYGAGNDDIPNFC
jgi:hypothetical protein